MKKVKPNPYGNDAEFKAYIRQSNMKAVLVIIACVALTLLAIFI